MRFTFKGDAAARNLGPKIAESMREMELQRRQLLEIIDSLQAQRRVILEARNIAETKQDAVKVQKYVDESSQLSHTIELVSQSELALTEGLTRLESMKQFGDIVNQVVKAYLTARIMSYDIREILEAYESSLYQSASTLKSFLEEMGRELVTVKFEPGYIDQAEILKSAIKATQLDTQASQSVETQPLPTPVIDLKVQIPLPSFYKLQFTNGESSNSETSEEMSA
jgi:hypothetical protein